MTIIVPGSKSNTTRTNFGTRGGSMNRGPSDQLGPSWRPREATLQYDYDYFYHGRVPLRNTNKPGYSNMFLFLAPVG
eukprot:scaffold339470_cov15-Prasinocladus_malaysianus.AAC.1